jgi:transposase
MKLHRNHRTCPSSRRLICERVLGEGWTLQEAAEAAGCSVRTAAKWLRRFRDGDLTRCLSIVPHGPGVVRGSCRLTACRQSRRCDSYE